MTRVAFVILFSAFAVFATSGPGLTQSVYQDAEKRVALVIGVSAYDTVHPLRNPLNDARAVAEQLRKLRFDVVETVDPGRAELAQAAQAFLAKLEGSDVALLYYAGHSIQIDGENYLVPKDAALRSTNAIRTETMAASEIVNAMDRMAKTKVIILDACRDNPFRDRLEAAFAHDGEERALSRGLARISPPEDLRKPVSSGYQTYGTIIAFAAAPGATASDGNGKHSPYTSALLDNLAKPGMELGRMFRAAAARVIKETKGRQKPEYLVRLTDEVYFARPEPNECDILAIAPYNGVGLDGIEFDDIKSKKAITACKAALTKDPGHPRYQHNLGRAYDAAARYKQAVEFYRLSAGQDYVPAIHTYGVMHINGQGTKQDFVAGVKLLKQAASRQYRLSKVALRSADFSKLFEPAEFRALQKRLKERGFYSGPIDGDFGDGSKEALRAFQEANDLRPKGATLETLDRLNLLTIIPNYELN